MPLEKLLNITHKKYTDTKFRGKDLACAFHAHTDAGSLDGGSTVERMIKRMKEVGMTHVTITEHGSINSAAAIHRIAKKEKMKIIHAVEAYIYWPDDIYGADKTYHINIFFKTREAFEAYCKLTPLIYSEPRVRVAWGDIKGCLYWNDFLEVAKHGIMVGTACIGGWLNRPLLKDGNIEESIKRAKLMIDTVGAENIYDEWIVDDLTHEYTVDDEKGEALTVNEIKPWFTHPDVIRESNRVRWNEVTKPLGIRRIASQDAHYALPEDKLVQDNKRYGSNWLMSFYQHVKGASEYAELAMKTQGITEDEVEELIDSTHDFVKNFDKYEFLTADDRGFVIPKFEGDAKAQVRTLIAQSNLSVFEKQEYKDRIEYELDVLGSSPKMDGLSYLLMVGEISNLAKQKGILCNLRGSASGSLCAYGLNISVADPIEYELPFERFITKGRIAAMSPPDMDIDTADKDGLDDAIRGRWGDCVAPISTDSLLKPRSAIRDVERYYFGKPRKETEDVLRTMETIPQGVNERDWLLGYTNEEGGHIEGAVVTNKLLAAYAENNPEIWNTVVKMCGVIRQKGVHACASVISSIPVHHFIPMYRVGGKNGTLCTGYSPKDVEYVGGLKVDVLGVSKMSAIQKCFEIIQQRHGKKYQWGELPHDENVYKMLWRGETDGLFQLQTAGITGLCVETKPKSIVDISALIAAFRPSVIDAESPVEGYRNMLEYFVAVKKGECKPSFIHKDLEPIYGSTAGVPLLQEQQLRVFRDLAGYSYEVGEGVRRAIGKKDAHVLAEHGNVLKKAVIEKGWTEKQADELFSMILASSRYGFNLSHATSYGIVGYNTAYLKYHYPLEYWCAELSVESENEDKIRHYAAVLSHLIQQPDITKSHFKDWIIEDGKLVAPLVTIKGCGMAISETLWKTVRAESLEDIGLVRRQVVEKAKRGRPTKS
jgi:DNA polymerase-3 subunit alpha